MWTSASILLIGLIVRQGKYDQHYKANMAHLQNELLKSGL